MLLLGAIHAIGRKWPLTEKEGKRLLQKFTLLKKVNCFLLYLSNLLQEETHQIRVHLQSVKTPVLGDNIYGSLKMNRKMQTTRLLLHAFKIEFPHPITGEKIKLSARDP